MTRPPQLEPSLVLFRDDLRVSDNPALAAAIGRQRPILCVFVLDEESSNVRPLGGAARWWLHGSLAALAEQLEGLGGRLDILRGRTIDCIGALIEATDARAVFWNRRYGSAERSIDAALKAHLLQHGRVTESFNASLLHEPWQVKPRSGDYFRVFTPFFKAARLLGDPEKPIDPPATITAAVYPEAAPRRVRLVDLALSPRNPDWSGGLQETWCPGERHAQQRLGLFLNQRIAGYARRTAAVIATRRNIASDGFYPPVHPVADWTNA